MKIQTVNKSIRRHVRTLADSGMQVINRSALSVIVAINTDIEGRDLHVTITKAELMACIAEIARSEEFLKNSLV